MIPDNYYKYSESPLWNETTVAPHMRKEQSSPAGEYLKICIMVGSLELYASPENGENNIVSILSPCDSGVILPEQRYQLKIVGPVIFYIAFYQEKDKKVQELEKKLEEKYESKIPHYEISQLISQGNISVGSKVLDVGCGGGRNSFLLADNGCVIDALDKSRESLAQVALVAQQNNWSITPREVNLEAVVLSGDYDLVFSTVVLQFLEKQRARGLIEQMQRVTKIGGYNIIIVPIDADDYLCPLRFPGLFLSRELQEVYQDWKIEIYSEMFGFFHRKDEQGNFYSSRFATLIAQKNI